MTTVRHSVHGPFTELDTSITAVWAASPVTVIAGTMRRLIWAGGASGSGCEPLGRRKALGQREYMPRRVAEDWL